VKRINSFVPLPLIKSFCANVRWTCGAARLGRSHFRISGSLCGCDAGGEAMRRGKGKVIVIALMSLFGSVHAALARWSHSECEALRGHFLRTCHCHPKYDDFARYRARLIGPFETEYNVENWEKAYRQGLAHWDRRGDKADAPSSYCAR
jgi:hypothetical protein